MFREGTLSIMRLCRRPSRLLLRTLAAGVVIGSAADRWPTASAREQQIAPAITASCERLAARAFPNTAISFARQVETGAVFDIAGQLATASLAFCRVAATLTPSPDSDIKIEVWMPAAGWNRKFQAVGNGAFSGAIAYPAMMTALRRGYAAASTDTGHSGNTAAFSIGHPEKLTDFGWRSVHEMSRISKQIIEAYYPDAIRYAYWNGCSAGGRQALQEAQRFPDDFDGIVAGAPGLDWTGRAAQALRVAKVLEASTSSRLLAPARRLLHEAALGVCDAADGVADGVIDNPLQCRFDPGVLQCPLSTGAACLTPAQVSTARLIYSSGVNARTGREIPGLLPGSELGWTDLGWTASARATGLEQFRFIVFQNPGWTADRFDFNADLARAEELDAGTINALNPDLRPFFNAGGKLIQYHGWSDPQISPAISPQYFTRVSEAIAGARIVDSYRLFMVPGMGHCSGGEGPNTFDMLTALERWVEEGQPPDRIVASHETNGVTDRTRPLCPYPQVAVYGGNGSTDDAANFVCRVRP